MQRVFAAFNILYNECNLENLKIINILKKIIPYFILLFMYFCLLLQMVQAIQVLRFHLLELEKVSNIPYININYIIYLTHNLMEILASWGQPLIRLLFIKTRSTDFLYYDIPSIFNFITILPYGFAFQNL